MPDPIRTVSPPPLRPLPLPPPPAPPAPSVLVSGLNGWQDTLRAAPGTAARAVDRWRPQVVPEDIPSRLPHRHLFPWLLNRLDQLTDTMMAERRAPVAALAPGARVQGLGWDPATATRYSNGSLQPPMGRQVSGAPAPGAGPLTPVGLANGNSVLRFGTDGQPANMPILDQGATNGCGTTSLAMMLDFHSGGREFTRDRVDDAIRHYNLFSSPGDIAEYAERHGLEASIGARLKVDDLTKLIDQGLPVQVLLDVSDEHDGTGLHYEVVTGYGTGPDGKRYLELANPWGQREYMAEDAFMARWAHLKGGPFPLGIDRVAIALKPPGHPAQLPPDSRNDFISTSMTALRVVQGLTQVTNGWARHDIPNLLGGVVRLVAGGLVAIPALLGHAARTWGEGYWRQGRAAIDAGSPVAGVAKMATGGLAWVAGIPFEGVGNVASRVVDLAATGVRGAGRGIAGLLS